jgi:hypothetical protein
MVIFARTEIHINVPAKFTRENELLAFLSGSFPGAQIIVIPGGPDELKVDHVIVYNDSPMSRMKPANGGGQTLLRLALLALDEFRGVKTPVADPGSFISAFDEET